MVFEAKNEDAKIGPEEEEILSFITQQGLVRWTDLINKFEKTEKWGHSKFVGHWKNIKQYLEKVPNKKTGRSLYKIKDQSQSVGDKALLRTQIGEGSLNSIDISTERFEKVAGRITKESFDLWGEAFKKSEEGMKDAREKLAKEGIDQPASIYEAFEKTHQQVQSVMKVEKEKESLFGKVKHRVSKKEKEEDFKKSANLFGLSVLYPMLVTRAVEGEKQRKQLMRIFENIKIQVVSSPGETAPVITDNDILNIINVVGPKIIDENKGEPREKPFQLIISVFPLEKPKFIES